MRKQIPDDDPSVPSLRTLGRRGQQACAGNDPRLGDARTTVAVGGTTIGLRPKIDFISAGSTSITGSENATNDSVELTISSSGGSGTLPDGDYGDIAVSGTGTVLTIDATGTRDDTTFLRGDSTWAHVETVRLPVKNTSGGTLTKGTPVYATGAVGASGVTEVSAADASSSATMPAIGLLEADLANNAAGFCCPLGVVNNLDTSGYAINGVVYVASGGGLTDTRPTGATTLVQNIGRVTRVQASTGQILVMGPGRSNDVPNKIDIAYLPTGASSTEVCVGNDARLSDRRSASAIHDGASDYPITAVADGQYLRRVSGNIVGATVAGGSDDTIYADAEYAARNLSAANVDICTRTFAVAAGDTIRVEAFGTVLNNSGAVRTYTVQATISSGVNTMTCNLADGGSIAANATNRSPHFVRAVFSVASITNAAVVLEMNRAVPGAANTGLSTAGTQVRQSWQVSTSSFIGSTVTVTLAMRSSATAATQTFYAHSWSITKTPERL